ncbi:xanthine dehydrogenase YagS FAD-binding subunit [Chitinophaga ginsengisegetis]|uniref:Xanthine dehydrogenase YagS FAD-binding subunit n=1 Tax=Chitinophaga ginsengisegetis TaxID=393003 RepID=A0A1T5NXG3_9BACT|nr:xanthine dehydrogenase family protein subunit M [Chitinophaga ginsengisegetis]MDR6567219.1 xanthine dehydrogenase YagS FAD-binding subunit [Chitinophaga ginsengisegetis]MDR6646949.1 xanthine dehydrogenase YagS FAD-binding subunit [Chitinophaga ginsengisegetis]MDR6653299.1 xanthine dehydrogenase YagS FAD-binding subunit [Chitinophaga ginsengisegetis]SKD05211.1 xanthine dehydrogenase YagS FAD-binding subunit [Chitinophaga ginsengisegetis]
MNQFSYVRPASLKAAIDAVAKDNTARFIAGGTNLLDLMKSGVVIPEKLVDINRLPLKDIQLNGNTLHIGALALNSELAAHELVTTHHPLLSQALLAGASQQLRNMATVGGNMMQRTRCTYFYDTTMPCNKRSPNSGCGAIGGINRMHAIFGASESCIAVHPSDMCVALAALDATVLVTGPKGNRRIPFTDFHRLPGNTPQLDNNLAKGELITAVEIPANAYTKNVYYLKVRDRASYAFALVSVAAALDISNNVIRSARLAMGGVAHKPWRLYDAEKALAGKAPTEENFRHAADIALQSAKAYTHNQFKTGLSVNSIQTALLKAASV